MAQGPPTERSKDSRSVATGRGAGERDAVAAMGAVTQRAAMGRRYARTTARTATRGTISATIRRGRGPITGARTASPASATTSSGCALRWRCGTAGTRSSRSGYSA